MPDLSGVITSSVSNVRTGHGSPFAHYKRPVELHLQEIAPRLSCNVSAEAEVMDLEVRQAQRHTSDRSTPAIVADLARNLAPFKIRADRLFFFSGETGPVTAAYLGIFSE